MPDIVISIGAGMKNASENARERGSDGLLDLLPKGIASGLKTLFDMKDSALDCEKKWMEVYNYNRGRSDLQQRYHRLNVILPSEPCGLDDTGAVPGLIKRAKEFLSPECRDTYDIQFQNCHAQLAYIAEDLLAKLFYFNAVVIERSESNGGPYEVTGQLRCRLDTRFRDQFEKLLEGGSKGPCIFRIRDHNDTRPYLDSRNFHWDFERFSTQFGFEMMERHRMIYVEMKFDRRPTWFPISGFPRILEVS